MDSLMIYSQRQMSYDSDALNAILGTLVTFTRHAIHHIWGVPMLLPLHEVSDKLSTGEATLDQYDTEVRSLSAGYDYPSHPKTHLLYFGIIAALAIAALAFPACRCLDGKRHLLRFHDRVFGGHHVRHLTLQEVSP